jgi:hypothetical protein
MTNEEVRGLGWDAFYEGEHRGENPYQITDSFYYHWDKGWEDAEFNSKLKN